MSSVTETGQETPQGKFPKNFVVILAVAIGVSLAIGMYISESMSKSKKDTAKQVAEESRKLDDAPKMDIQAELDRKAAEAAQRIEERKREEEKQSVENPLIERPPVVLAGQSEGSQQPEKSDEDQKSEIMREQAASSPLLSLNKGAGVGGSAGALTSEAQASLDALARRADGEGLTPSAPRGLNEDWLKTFNTKDEEPVPIFGPRHKGPVLHEGSTIPVVLNNALNSQLPGMVIASSTHDVYDSITGQTLLIPRGTKFIGRFNSEVRDGQDRLMFAFRRMIYPDGREAMLKAMEGGDKIGTSGVEGDVDTKFWEMLGSSLLVALMAVGLDSLDKDNSGSNVTINNGGSGGSTYTTAAGEVMVKTAETSLSRYTKARPVIKVPPGTQLNVMVNKDIIVQ